MQTYIAILRGINVSGQKSIKMIDLIALCEKIGFQSVKTYIQSGNVVFNSVKSSTIDLANRLQQAIQQQYGFEVPVIVISSQRWNQVAENNPFLAHHQEGINKLHVTFLAEKPANSRIALLAEGQYGNDEYKLVEDMVYLFCPGSYGETKLSNKFLETKLQTTATTRNWKTVLKLQEMIREQDK